MLIGLDLEERGMLTTSRMILPFVDTTSHLQYMYKCSYSMNLFYERLPFYSINECLGEILNFSLRAEQRLQHWDILI